MLVKIASSVAFGLVVGLLAAAATSFGSPWPWQAGAGLIAGSIAYSIMWMVT